MISPTVYDRWNDLVPRTSNKNTIKEFVDKISNNMNDLKTLKEYIEHTMWDDGSWKDVWMGYINDYLK